MKELRCLVFSEQEVAAAVQERRKKLQEQILDGTLQKVSYQSDSGVSATLVGVDQQGRSQSLVIPDNELSAALVNFCMSRKIPMPVKSDKYLQVINDGLTMMITMRFNKSHKSGGS